ncbi:MAG TPA: beta-galactosidase trimerization domain-containing protein, partial [Ignavibacteriaceae bacterium]
LPGYTLDLPKPIYADDVKKFIFSGVAGNQKGFIFWQYRPEVLGRETPTWGLTYLDGEETSWLDAYADCGKVLQKNADFILNAKPKKAEVAILYNPENQIFSWASTGNEKTATDSLLGFHRALYERNYIVDFIHPIEFEKNILKNYKVLVIPFPYVLNKKIAGKIVNWVKNGGVLLTESYTAGWNIEKGHHEKVVPGYGLDKIYKVKQAVVKPDADGNVKIILDQDLPYLKKGSEVYGSIVKETFINNGASIIASFDSGEPAIFLSKFGNGRAIQIGSYIGLKFHREKIENNGNLISGLIESTTKISKPIITDNKKVRVDVLSSEEKKLVIVQNIESKNVNVSVQIPGEKFLIMVEQFSGEKIICKKIKSGVEFKLKLNPREVKVYRA